MIVRILSAVFLLPLLLVSLILLPEWFNVVLFGLMAAVAAWELLRGTGILKAIRPVLYSSVMAFVVVATSIITVEPVWILLAIFLFTVLLIIEMMISRMEIQFSSIAVCYVAGIVVPYLFASMARLYCADNGKFLVLIPFLISFVADSGAYFTGMFCGKHKLAPVISPKKTIEGAIGGVVAAIGGMAIFCIVLNIFFGFSVNYAAACIYGFVGAIVCIFGDLSFSVIKRQTGIKDYGNLIPGHGGILDRFDSTIFVAPVVEVLIIFWPVVVR